MHRRGYAGLATSSGLLSDELTSYLVVMRADALNSGPGNVSQNSVAIIDEEQQHATGFTVAIRWLGHKQVACETGTGLTSAGALFIFRSRQKLNTDAEKNAFLVTPALRGLEVHANHFMTLPFFLQHQNFRIPVCC